jgi:Cu(I)/Ag(I) efflux system membrane fusion protein
MRNLIMANENTPQEIADPIVEAAGITSPPPQLTGRQKLRLVGLVIMKRVRFFAILAGVGLFIVQWDNIKSHWDRWTHPRATASRELPSDKEFFCSMDPQVVRSTYEPNGDVPNCPICGMPLSIHDKGQKEELPAGITGRVRLSPDRVHMAGIQTVVVDYRPMSKQIKTVGYVTFDESGLSRVVSRFGGYVEKLYVDKSFTMVHKGDPLVEIYSPEFYSAAKKLILAKRFGVERDVADSESLLLLGVSEAELREIAAAKEPPTRLVIRAPQSGHIVDKKIVAGASVEAKTTLFEVADLSTVWIEAEVFDDDIPFLEAGQKIKATVESYPNRTFSGKIALVHPHLEIATRTNRVRFTLDNPNHELRPGMYAAVTIDTPLETIEPYKSLAAKTSNRPVGNAGYPSAGHGVPVARQSSSSRNATEGVPYSGDTGTKGGEPKPHQEFLVVPEQAVVDTGAKKIVYVQRHEGEFEGVEVTLGPRQDDFYPVLTGLAYGDRVVAAGGFLVDAETRLNPAAASTFFGASGSPPPGSAPPLSQGTARDKITATRSRASIVPSADDIKNIEQLPQEEWQPAKVQGMCPITENALGSMGEPVKIMLRGKPVYLCCKGCIGKAKRDPDGTLKKIAESQR